MKKIFLVTVISFCAILKLQAQTKTVTKDSLSVGAVLKKVEIDTQLAVKSSKQNLIKDSSENNKTHKRYYEVITHFVVSKIKDSSFIKVEVNTEFPEDAERWKQYLMKNLNASTPSINKAKLSTYQVIVRFIENKDGYFSDVRALTNNGYGMEAEVYRKIRKGQKSRWTPSPRGDNTIKPYRK